MPALLPEVLKRIWPALKFAFWTYFWTLGIFLGLTVALRYSERWRHVEPYDWWSPIALWENVQEIWRFPLPILLAGLLASLIDPCWYKGFTLILTPFITLLVWESAMTLWVTCWMLPAALLASLPDLLRSRRRNHTHIP